MADGELETRGGGAVQYLADRIWPVLQQHSQGGQIGIRCFLMVIRYGSQRAQSASLSVAIQNNWSKDGNQVILAFANGEAKDDEDWMNGVGYAHNVRVDKETLKEALRRLLVRQRPAWLDVAFKVQDEQDFLFWRNKGCTYVDDTFYIDPLLTAGAAAAATL